MLKFCKLIITITAFVVIIAATDTKGEVRDPFSGRWRLDTQTIGLSNSQLIIQLDEKGFGRSTGTAVESKTPADGKFHSLEGSGYVDSVAVNVISGSEVVEIDKVKGRRAYENRYVLTENGQLLTWNVISYANVSKTAVAGSSTWRRVSGDSKSTHPLAGKWQQTGVSSEGGANDFILDLSGNDFSNRTPDGSGYTAQFGGSAVPNEGDSAGAKVSVVRPDANTIVEYHSLKGIVGGILVLQANGDSASLKAIAIAPKTGKATSFVLRRVTEAQ